jgi:hypothetical protein
MVGVVSLGGLYSLYNASRIPFACADEIPSISLNIKNTNVMICVEISHSIKIGAHKMRAETV